MIDNSVFQWYMPAVDPRLGEGCFYRWLGWWETYDALWDEFGMKLDEGGNVTRSMLQDEYDSLPDSIVEPWEVPSGLMPIVGLPSLMDQFAPIWAPLSGTPLPGQARAVMMFTGLVCWQMYRLMLAQQAVKLSVFHRRGRP